jgi:hypothetical protein
MKQFLIKYRLKSGSEERWHQDNDPALRGKISYRCMKSRGGSDYYHLATAADDDAVKLLQAREFFLRYTEETKRAAGGEVEVLPLEIVAETA